MDTFVELQSVTFDSFVFNSSFYEEYQSGQMISRGKKNVQIKCTNENGIINFKIDSDNSLDSKIISRFQFDNCITLQDRLFLYILPEETNVEDMSLIYLKSMPEIPFTRDSKYYTPLEPVIGNLFSDNGKIAKVSFKMQNPERLIEFY